jgi:hypothetical protein
MGKSAEYCQLGLRSERNIEDKTNIVEVRLYPVR